MWLEFNSRCNKKELEDLQGQEGLAVQLEREACVRVLWQCINSKGGNFRPTFKVVHGPESAEVLLHFIEHLDNREEIPLEPDLPMLDDLWG